MKNFEEGSAAEESNEELFTAPELLKGLAEGESRSFPFADLCTLAAELNQEPPEEGKAHEGRIEGQTGVYVYAIDKNGVGTMTRLQNRERTIPYDPALEGEDAQRPKIREGKTVTTGTGSDARHKTYLWKDDWGKEKWVWKRTRQGDTTLEDTNV